MPTPEELDRRTVVAVAAGSPLRQMVDAHREGVATKPKPDSAEWWQEVAQGLGVTIHILRAERDALLAELKNIADANPSTWEPDVRDQFRQWAQNRARTAIAKAEGSRLGARPQPHEEQ